MDIFEARKKIYEMRPGSMSEVFFAGVAFGALGVRMSQEEIVKILHPPVIVPDPVSIAVAQALNRLIHDSMYKDHPEASQMAIDALQSWNAANPDWKQEA